MKRTVLYIITCLLFVPAIAQRTSEDYYTDGMKYAERKNYKEAISFFDMAIRLKADDYYSMHQRGICKALMNNYGEAIEDFKHVLSLKPDYTKAMIAMGNCYKRLTFYDTAINQYSRALEMEPDNSEALYHRAHVYESMNMADSAAEDFKELEQMGVDVADKMKYYKDTVKSRPQLNTITKLTQTSADATYGFTSKNPIKVGTGKQGGFGNVRAYLALLRDAKKKPVSYKRIQACCSYRPKTMPNNVLAEEYEITYTDETGTSVTKKLYLSYFEYEEPKIPLGLAAATK
jgi:tetratricopeptide (TPR) repeat protein